MGVAPDPQEVHERAETEGRRRLRLSSLEQATTGFIAGVTIVFGKVSGALAFGIGVVFPVVGRAELFTEDFFDPVALAIDEAADTLPRDGRHGPTTATR